MEKTEAITGAQAGEGGDVELMSGLLEKSKNLK